MPVDLNCDLGEGNQLSDCDHDAQLMSLISRCNICCGAHAGNQQIIEKSIENAARHKIKIGAHPGYADKANFGRRSLQLDWTELQTMLQYQLDGFFDLSDKQNMKVDHIKLHGALYNDVESSQKLADQYAAFLSKHHADVDVVGLANGCLQNACADKGLRFLREGFMDRRYLNSGKLMPRDQAGAVLSNVDQIVEQALQLIHKQPIITASGVQLQVEVDTICLHGDGESALQIANQLSARLQSEGLTLL